MNPHVQNLVLIPGPKKHKEKLSGMMTHSIRAGKFKYGSFKISLFLVHLEFDGMYTTRTLSPSRYYPLEK